MKNGLARYWSEAGSIIIEGEWTDGKLVSTECWDAAGKAQPQCRLEQKRLLEDLVEQNREEREGW